MFRTKRARENLMMILKKIKRRSVKDLLCRGICRFLVKVFIVNIFKTPKHYLIEAMDIVTHEVHHKLIIHPENYILDFNTNPDP